MYRLAHLATWRNSSFLTGNKIRYLILIFTLLLAVLVQTRSVDAHYLNMTQAWALMDQATLDMISDRAAVNDQPLIRAGDEITLVMKAYPDDGTQFGAGGYMTFFIPEGTQVVDTAYVYPDGGGGYAEIPVKQPSPTDDDGGDRGADSIPELIGLVAGPNAIGRSEPMVNAAGATRGTLAGVMGDTGVFYSTDPTTAWRSWHESQYCANPNGDCTISSQTNGSTDPFSAWDAMQTLAYGNATGNGADVQNLPANPLGTGYIDPSGHGSTAWGLANAVAGPESGYQYAFDLDTYDGSASSSNVKASVSNIGPWNRIQYPGSTISDDLKDPGNPLAVSVQDASQLGRNINSNPLPPTLDHSDGTSPNAIRFSVGGIEQGRYEYISITLRILEDPGSSNPNPYDSNGCFEAHAGTFAGDAGYTSDNKDHIYRYIKFSAVTFNPCTQLLKSASVSSAKSGDTFNYYISFVNSGGLTIPPFTITDVLPAGLTYNAGASSAEYIDASTNSTTTVTNSGTGGTQIYDLASHPASSAGIEPGDIFRATINVTATSDGPFQNTVSTDGAILPATEDVAGPNTVVIVANKSVDPETAPPGSTIQYTLILDNPSAGDTSAGEDIVVRDFLPDDFTYAGNALYLFSNGPTGTPSVDASDLENPIFTVNGQILSGETLSITFDALIDVGVPVGTYVNSMEATFQGPIGTNQATCYGCAPVFTAASSIGDYVFYDWDGDGIQDPAEEGVAGVTIQLTPPAGEDIGAGPGNPITTVTDANGLYLFPGLGPGEYTVELLSSNFNVSQPLEDWNSTPTFDPDNDADLTSTVTVGTQDEIRDRDWGFAPAGSGAIGDFIFEDPNGNGDGDDDGIGIDGVTVYLYEDTDGNGVVDPGVDQLVTVAVTAGGGAYQFTGLPEGKDYLVYVNPFDPAVAAEMPDSSYVVSTGNPISVPNLTGTVDTADIGFRDVPESSIGDQLCTDSNNDGACTLADAPLPNVTITLWNDVDGNGRLDPAVDTVITTQVSGGDGSYDFTGLPPGDYIVDVDNNDPDVPDGFAPSVDEIAVNIPVPPPGAGSGSDIDTADFPFVPLITKSVSSATASPTDILTFNIDVQYPGDELLSSVIVTDAVPTGTTYVAGSANAGGTESGGIVTWNLGSNNDPVPGFHDGFESFDEDYHTDKDTYIWGNQSSRNYGADTILRVDPRENDNASRALVEFDISSIPSNAVIDFAYVELFQTAVGEDATTLQIDVHALTQAWDEGSEVNSDGEASWEERMTGNAWTTDGGDFVGTPAYSLDVTLSTDETEFEFIITDLVQAWVNGGQANHGIIFKAASETAGDDKQFHAFTSSDGTKDPELVVIYRVPEGDPRNNLLSAAPTLAQDGATIEVTMVLTGETQIDNVEPQQTLTVNTISGDATAICGNPSPSGPFAVGGAAGDVTVTYSCTVTGGSQISQLTFRADATDTVGTFDYRTATSNSVIIAPSLTFQAEVNRPPSADPILNSAFIRDSDVIPTTESNVTSTALRGAIGDTIYFDANGNGVQDGNEFGIAGVTVQLDGPGGTQSVVTDENGVYIFTDLDAGTYAVTVQTGTLPVASVQSADPDTTLDDTTQITIGDGEFDGSADFGYNPQLIVKAVNQSEALPNDTLTYTTTVIYPFDAQLTNVTVTDTIPVGTTYVPSSAIPSTVSGPDPLLWTVGSNQPGTPGLAYVCADSTTILASQATWITEQNPDDNEDGSNLAVKDDTNEPKDNHALVQFDLSSVPANAQISAASLGMHVQSESDTLSVSVTNATGTWNEASVTWNSAPAAGTSYGTFMPDPNNVYIDTDITTLVTSWVDGSITNNGLRLVGSSASDGDSAAFFDEDETDMEPRLTIAYEYISPDGCLQTVRVPVEFDTYIEQENPTNDNSTDNPLVTRPESGKVKRALLQFNIDSYLPAGAIIDGADLYVTSRNSRSNHTVNIYRVTSIWSATASWNSPWSSNGGDFDNGTSYGTFIPNQTEQSADVSALVKAWAAGSFPNYGFILSASGSDNGDAQWASQEDNNNPSRDPYLEVTFRSPQVTTLLPVTQDTYIEEDDQAANNGAANQILTRPQPAGQINRSLFQFDISALPSGSTVTDATVYVNSNNTRTNHQVRVRQMTSAWTETANWTTADGATPWATNGGDFTGAYGSMQPTANDVYQPADVTGLVQLWASGTPNYGLVLDPIGTDAGDAQWNTREEGNYPAYIEVTYDAQVFGGSSMNIDRALVSDGDTFNLTLTLTATLPVVDVSPGALSITDITANGASATCGSPSPATQDVTAAGATFSWACTASAAAEVGNLIFNTNAADASGLLTFAEATSDSVLVAPPFVFQVTVNNPLEVGRIDNIAYIQETGGTIPPTPSNEVQTALGPDLVINKSAPAGPINLGGAIQYTLAITNSGQSDATGVVVTDTLPVGTSYVGSNITPGGGSCSESGGVVTCNVPGTLTANGGSASITIDVTYSGAPSSRGMLPMQPRSTISAETISIPSVPITRSANNSRAPQANENICFAVADEPDDRLVSYNRVTNTTTGIGTGTGPSGTTTGATTGIEAIVMTLDGNTVYAANRSTFGTLNTSTGAFSSIGSFGTAGGNQGEVLLADVDGLAIDPRTGIYWGAARRGDSSSVIIDDLLFQFDPATGQHIPNAFGSGVDYLVIGGTAAFPTTNLEDVDDIAINPTDGKMYGVINNNGSGDRLIEISMTHNGSGVAAVTDIGRFANSSGGANINDLEGFSFGNDGIFYATTGDGAGGLSDKIWTVNLATAQVTELGDLTIGTDYEAVACLTDGSNTFSGIVFQDNTDLGNYNPGSDAVQSDVTIRLYLDNGINPGVFDDNDTLIQTTVSSSDGSYSFETAVDGDFVVVVDETSFPPLATGTTTDSEHDLTIIGYENSTTNLNFGFSVSNTDLQVEKLVDDALVNETQAISYKVVATNNGPNAGTAVVATDELPSGVNLVSSSATAGSYDSGSGTWTIGNLAANETVTLTLNVTVSTGTQGSTILNSASITGNEIDLVPSNNSTSLPIQVVCLAESIYNIAEVGSNEFDANSSNNSDGACTLVADTAPQTASIGDRVWLDENGNGVQDAGEDGLANVTVVLLDSGGTPVMTTTTGIDGGYIFKDVVPGDYTVVVDPNGDLTAGLTPTYDQDGDVLTPNESTPVTVAAGDEIDDIDFGYNWNPTDSVDPASPDTIPDPTGAIGDRVWIDADGDGVQDLGEPGIGGITVELLTDDNGDGIYGGAGDNAPATTTTADDGSYIFDNVPAGSYVVNIPTPPAGYTQTGDPDGTLDNQTTAPIILAPGDVYLQADFGYDPPDEQDNSIGDTIFVDANGDGDEDAGEPGVPGVTVNLLDADGDVIATTITNANGNYLFNGVPDGTYTVQVTDTNNVLGTMDNSADPDTPATPDNQAVVSVDPTSANPASVNEDTADFGYVPENHDAADGLIGDTVFLDRNGNSSADAGEGLEGVTVELRSADGSTVLQTTTTDENGNYFFGDLDPNGTYTVRVDTATLPNGGAGLTNSVDPDGNTASESVIDLTNDPDTVNDGVNLGQDFGYSADTPRDISGTIWEDTNADGTLDGDEPDRFGGVTVVLRDSDGDIVATTTTALDGTYNFDNVPPGVYTVDVTDDTNVLGGYWSSTSDPRPVDVTTADATNVDFGYYSDLASIGNFVWNDDGDGIQEPGEPGIANVPVTLTITYPNNTVVTVVTQTDSNGEYSFDNLLADENYDGVGTPATEGSGGGDEPYFEITVGTPTGATPAPVDAGGDDETDSDYAVNGTAATPTQGATDNSYDFAFITPDSATIGNRVWLDENGDGVQDAGEDGIANVVVTLTPPAGVDLGNGDGVPITTTTGTDGGYIFTDLPPNVPYTVSITPPAGMNPTYDENGVGTPNTTTVTPTEGAEHDSADFGLNWVPPTDSTTPAQNATGAIGDYIWNDADGDGVQDPNEIGLAGITVRLFSDPDGDGVYDTPAGTATTDDSGHYIFDGLTPDAYVVQVDPTNLPTGWNPAPTGDPDGDGDNTSDPIVVAPGDVVLSADFGYQPTDPVNTGSTIGDTLFIDTNRDDTYTAGTDIPLEGVTVNLLDADGDVIATTTTDENGQYTFPNLPAGTYTVDVTDTDNVLGDLQATFDDDGGNDNQSTTTVDGTNDVLDQDFAYVPAGHDANEGFIGDTIFIDTDNDDALSDGEGVEGVTVTLTDAAGNTTTTTTDENGNYYFGGLIPTATYTVTVDTATLPGDGTGLFNFEDPDNGNDSQSVVNLNVTGPVDLDQDFGYEATTPNTIGGTIWNDTDADGTLDSPDETGRYQGVTVVLRDNDGNIVAKTVTDVNGDYTFENLPDGTYTVDVTDEDNVLAGTWHSDGPNDNADNNSQVDPYSVTVNSGNRNDTTGDFGYYSEPASIGNFVWDDDGDGIQGPGEPGIPNVPVTLTITYPTAIGDTTVVLNTTTDENGLYSFDNLLADESYNGDGVGSEPTYVITVGTPSGATSVPQDATTEDADSDNPDGETVMVVQGETNNTYDFGFDAPDLYAIGNLIWIDGEGTGNGTYNSATDTVKAGITVNLYRAPGGVAEPTPFMTTTTNAMGAYQFTGLPAGEYEVGIPASEFKAGGKLLDDEGTALGVVGPNSQGEGNLDDGSDHNTIYPTANNTVAAGVRSTVITLGGSVRNTEPTLEPAYGLPLVMPDNQTNWTVDFAFAPRDATAVGLTNISANNVTHSVLISVTLIAAMFTLRFVYRERRITGKPDAME